MWKVIREDNEQFEKHKDGTTFRHDCWVQFIWVGEIGTSGLVRPLTELHFYKNVKLFKMSTLLLL